MKILLVITKSEIGGAQVFLLNLAKMLKVLGYQVEVAGGEGDYLKDELRRLGIKFHYIKSLKRNVSLFNHLSFSFDLYSLLSKNLYDIVHLNSSNTLMGIFAIKFLRNKPKTVFTFHGLSLVDKDSGANKYLKFFAFLYFKYFLKFVDRTVFVSNINYSEAIQDKIVKTGSVIYNGLNLVQDDFYDKDKSRNYFSNLFNYSFSDYFLLGSTGRLAFQKNYEFLIENFNLITKSFPLTKLIIIGEGPNRELYDRQIKELGLEKDIFLVGALKESHKYIKAFDIFVLPSRYEGLSISIIEALFAGIPILATDVGGNSEIVGNDSNQLYKLNDIEDFVGKFKWIRHNSDPIIEYNGNRKSMFDSAEMVKQYEEIYKSLLKYN
ncbi:MAG: glycosyltransferase [Bacteroidota bacterium]